MFMSSSNSNNTENVILGIILMIVVIGIVTLLTAILQQKEKPKGRIKEITYHCTQEDEKARRAYERVCVGDSPELVAQCENNSLKLFCNSEVKRGYY